MIKSDKNLRITLMTNTQPLNLLLLKAGGWGSATHRRTVKLMRIISTSLLIDMKWMKVISTNILIYIKLLEIISTSLLKDTE